MIRSKYGEIGKRVVSFLAVLVVLHAAALECPARAAAALPVIGAAITVSAFLMASGVYPFIAGDGIDFDGWSNEKLRELWNQYQIQAEVTPPSFDKISALLSAGTLLIGNTLWQELIKFVDWIKSEFDVVDNQEGGQIGVEGFFYMGGNPFPLEYFADSPVEIGITDGEGGVRTFRKKNDGISAVGMFHQYGGTNWISGFIVSTTLESAINGFAPPYELPTAYVYNGVTYYLNTEYAVPSEYNAITKNNFPPILEFNVSSDADTKESLFQALTTVSTPEELIHIDTTTFAPPAALPETAQFGGLSIPAAGLSPTVEQVSQVIENGVVDRAQPQVVPVEVEIGAGTEVDTETGVIAQNPVEITQESAIPGADALVSQPLITAIANTMQTKFPFCLPFDIMRLFRAFNATPQAPQIALTFHDPFSEHDYTISVDLSPWDNVAGTVRQFETMILFVGFWLNFDKFNILNTILGQLG